MRVVLQSRPQAEQLRALLSRVVLQPRMPEGGVAGAQSVLQAHGGQRTKSRQATEPRLVRPSSLPPKRDARAPLRTMLCSPKDCVSSAAHALMLQTHCAFRVWKALRFVRRKFG